MGADLLSQCHITSAWPPRQRQVLLMLLEGESAKRIALALGISAHTVHTHVKSIYKRVGVETRAELLSHFLVLAARRLQDRDRELTSLQRATQLN